MKLRIFWAGVGLCLALGGGGTASGAEYYINDEYVPGDDIYTSARGNDGNPGTAALPKATLGNVVGTCNLQPGDVVYIDTGTYAPAVISNTVVGTVGNPIVFQGSTNYVANGATFTGGGINLAVRGRYLHLQDIRAVNGTEGIQLYGASFCTLERAWAASNSMRQFNIDSSSSNLFRSCVGVGSFPFRAVGTGPGNRVENSVLYAPGATVFSIYETTFSNIVNCIIVGETVFHLVGYVSTNLENNIFGGIGLITPGAQTLNSLLGMYPGWKKNTVADPLFANTANLDFHLLSPAGYVSNGVWVTNAAVGYSPAIDFGTRTSTAWTNEPAPNGGRVNVGLYGGTAEASKSRSGPWVFALSFNDGGNLIQTGRLEWVASTNLTGANVALEYTTNRWATTSTIATVPATNESYTWVPASSHPSVLWRVRDPISGFASTNAKAFSLRATTNATFTFYVNDASTNNDVYCTAAGSTMNSGVSSNSPLADLQALLTAYDLEGGDTVVVDTGTYILSNTVRVSQFDSGAEGRPVRIMGSPKGVTFNRGSTSADVLDISGASYLEIENLRLMGGASGIAGGGSTAVTLRNMQFVDNRRGINLLGASVRTVFERCLAANNTDYGYYDISAASSSNQWNNGVIWGSTTLLHVRTNALSVSNSILGQATALFAFQVPPGNYNVVWATGVGLQYNTFTELQSAGLGWDRSVFANPLFANAAQGDFHVRSTTGRYDTNLLGFVSTDTNYSAAIDVGDPAAAVGDEPSPNGGRLNAGLYGGTAQASKSRTNAWLQAMSYLDGGTLDAQAGATLRWTGGGYPTNSTVSLWLSRDNGANWTNIASGVLASSGEYFFASTNIASSLFAMWKVELEGADPAVTSPSGSFAYKSGAYVFYVNDVYTTNDVYCLGAGNDANLGVTPEAPMATLQKVIATYQLGPGDRIYIDTGSYVDPNTVTLTSLDSGSSSNWIEIVGSTNRQAGGTVFGQRSGQPASLRFDFRAGASNIIMRDIILTNVVRGVGISNSASLRLDGVEVRGATSRAFELGAGARGIELTHCVAYKGAGGVYLNGLSITNIAIRNSLFWENSGFAVQSVGTVGLTVENSILASTRTNVALIGLASLAGVVSDYNNLHAGINTRVGSLGAVLADNVAAWQAMTGGQDLHSIPGDPQMADPDQYDYHLKTQQTLGRRKPNGEWTSDPVSSPLLDAGNPASAAYTNEPMPNGGRINIGRFGGTAEASSAQTIPWIRTVSFGDGGSVSNGVIALRWLAGGFSTETADVHVSLDGGQTWGVPVASGVPITNGVATWVVSGGLPDTPAAMWRVTCVENTNQWAESTTFFAVRKSPLNIYVATADTNDNIYATAPAAANNWMATATAPLDSLRSVFDRFDLEGGDQIWVDSGRYIDSDAIVVGMKNSGTTGNPVRVTGNTQQPYRGTVLARSARTIGSSVFQISQAGGIHLEALAISNAWTGIQIDTTGKAVLERVRVVACGTNAVQVGAAATMELNRSILEQSLASGLHTFTGATVQVRHSFIRNNNKAGLFFRGGNVEVKNSILESAGTGGFAYYLTGSGTLVSDYNNIRASEGAYVAGGDNRVSDRFLIDWQRSSARDMSSFGYAANFADEAGYDFHLQSEHGRFDPATAMWTNDAITSKLIDLGDPVAPYANEPAPNGGRVNVGLYGNTSDASKSSGSGSLVPLTMSDGGTIRGEATLYWAFINLGGATPVEVRFSWDGGDSWTNIATGLYADDGLDGISWMTTNFPSTAMGVWEVRTTTNVPPIIGRTETYFAIKNEPVAYYVNDARTNGDVYCEAAGSALNTGLTPDSPLNSLATLLARYKVEHGDIVYVDTGIYPRSTPLVIAIPSLAATNRLVIQGSTNELAGGTVFTNSGSSAVLELDKCRFIDLRDLHLKGGRQGLLLTESSSNRAFQVRSTRAQVTAFEIGVQSDQNEFIRCAALDFMRTGLHVRVSASQAMAPTTNHWRSGVISSFPATTNGLAVTTGTLVGVQSGLLTISNSVLVANGPEDVVFQARPGVIQGDYNAYSRVKGALLGRVDRSVAFGVQTLSFAHLNTWQDWNGSDSNSLEADPQFADLAKGDLHLRSQGGRWDWAVTNWVLDAVTSPLVDAGDPTAAPGLETNRLNIGIYGGTKFASRSPLAGADSFSLLTLNAGGVVSNTVTLRWQARGGATNGDVTIWLSTNSGASEAGWQVIGTTSAAAGSYVWNTTTNLSTPTARWRVRHFQISGVETASQQDFLIHNEPLTYYVNDASTNNDLWCSQAGSITNTGLSTNSPLPMLADVLDRYDLEPGDTVRLDTGEYTAPAEIGYLDSGTDVDPVVIEGSTQYPGVLLRGAGLSLNQARGVEVRHIRLQPHSWPLAAALIRQSEDIRLEHVDIYGGMDGVAISQSSNVHLRHFLVTSALTNGVASYASFNTRLEHGTIWSNKIAQITVRSSLPSGTGPQPDSYVSVSNCILGSYGLRIPVYEQYGTVHANYNNLFLAGGALAAISYTNERGFPREFDSVAKWSVETGMDRMSLSHEPQFANVAAGDFHLKTQALAGRWDPVVQAWTNDVTSSPLIDAGDPGAGFANEPAPNGGRVNLGRYGNTVEASKTPTNGLLTLVGFNDGGRATGTNVVLTWLARGSATTATITIAYSADGGATWTNLVTGVDAATGFWIWDSTLVEQTVQGALRIEGTDGSVGQNDQYFSVRNRPFFFFVNDGSRTNDVYCTAIGNNANSGLTSSEPMADLNALLAKYDLEGGDIVYIDTGDYRILDPWRITQADSAGTLETNPVVIQGSTNVFPSGTVLSRSRNPIGIQVDYAIGLQIRNITVSNTLGTAMVINRSLGVDAEWIAVGQATTAFQLIAGSQLRVANCAVYDAVNGIEMGTIDKTISEPIFPMIENNVLWNLAGYGVRVGNGYRGTVRNNIMSVQPGKYVYELAALAELTADYNAIWLGDGGRVYRKSMSANESPVPIIYETVGSWAAASGQDTHSIDSNPRLADPAALDFHLQSQGGRWDPLTKAWKVDATNSPLIDAGWPGTLSWTNEPTPNGKRVNIGVFGGSREASKSPTNSALHLLTLNRGGVASGQVNLNWLASGATTGHTLRLSVSVDNGSSWTVVASNLAASLGGVIWNSASLPQASSPLALWRVASEQETVSATSELNFVLHNSPIAYYVNDDISDFGDVYCTAAGHADNTGLSPDSPKRWISEILETYNLEPGDIMYVDTGVYAPSEPTIIGDLDAGEPTQDPGRQVTIKGSTNAWYGGTLYFISDPSLSAFEMVDTYGVRLQHLRVTGASNAVAIKGSYYIAGDWLEARDCRYGLWASGSSNLVVTHCTFAGNTGAGVGFNAGGMGTLHVGNSVLWSNRYGIELQQGYAFASNSIFGMVAPESFAYYMRADQPLTAFQTDYNNLFVGHPSGAIAGYQTGGGSSARTTTYGYVSTWTERTGLDPHSLTQDPLLVNPADGDYHLRSVQGRYQAGSGWVTTDIESSPLIDAGHPQSTAWLMEPSPNGRRLNIGMYGGTAEASKTPQAGKITCIFPSPGARVSDTTEILWSVIGAATNHTVTIEYSGDNGVSWTNVTAGWPASTGSFAWNTASFQRSARAWWRISSDQNLSIADSMGTFMLDNEGSIPYYVNDASTNGDVYCTAIGNDANDGLTPATPMASLQAILDNNNLAPEDIVYVDTGTYIAGAPAIQITPRNSGWSNLYVTIQGSTNPAAPTIFKGSSRWDLGVFSFDYAENVRLRDLTIRDASIGVVMNQSIGCTFERVRIENNQTIGVQLSQCQNIGFLQSVLWKNTSPAGGEALVLNSASVVIENCTIWNHVTAVAINQGTLRVTNSALDARGANGRIFRFSSSASAATEFRGDYNLYSFRNDNSLLAEQQTLTGGSDYYNTLPIWSAAVSSETHSITLPPLFANETLGDFHPRSTQGRFTPSGWVQDGELSPLIDAGHSAATFANEPLPNGERINIGAYGNTLQASMTQTNPPWVRVASYNECSDTVTGDALLYWLYGGLPSNELVRLEYTTDFWNWTIIASNLHVGVRQYSWDVSDMPLAVAMTWRVVVQSNPTIVDASDCPVAIKTKNYKYYINDGSTNGDVYCTAPGAGWDSFGAIRGTNPAVPLDSIQTLLEHLPVGAGDEIFIDTGVYSVSRTNAITLNDRNMGSTALPLKIYGSPNRAAGGTWFKVDGTTNGLRIQNTRHIHLHDLRVSGAQNGLLIENVDTIRIQGGTFNRNLANGILSVSSSGVDIRNTELCDNGSFGYRSVGSKGSQTLQNSTLWGNRLGAADNGQGTLMVSNSILAVSTPVSIYQENGVGIIAGNYNLFWNQAGGPISENIKDRVAYSYLSQWQAGGRDLYSVVIDPLLVNPIATNYHLRSREGYWNNGGWLAATNTSWAIDAGDPATPEWTNEPLPNANRINLGAQGGTPYASKTDNSTPELLAVSLRDGGVALEVQQLYWLFRGLSPTNTVSIWYSPDNRGTWTNLTSAHPINEPYNWYSQAEPTPEAWWKVVLDGNTNVVDETGPFTHRTRALTYYVNDDDRTGDIYTGAIGATTNLGYVSNSPLSSIQAVLDRFQLSPGDEIKVDTGEYTLDGSIFISLLNKGNSSSGGAVKFTGSTNVVHGGSRLVPAAGMDNPAFLFYNAAYVNLSSFHLDGFKTGVALQESTRQCRLIDLDIRGAIDAGVVMDRTTDTYLERVLIREGQTNAIVAGSGNFTMNGCVIWSNQGSALFLSSGVQMGITNSVLEASGVGRYCYHSYTTAVIQANYNNLLIRNGAEVASINNQSYPRNPQWTRATAQDTYSLSVDPLFYDPANGDFHLRSKAGRYDPVAGQWTNDMSVPELPDFSPLIDMGSSRSAWSNEPTPHGSRRNIGLYGNTTQASKSDTNAWVQVITASGGGLTYGTFNLAWGYGGNISSGQTARLEYSFDNGLANWDLIAEVPIGNGSYPWVSTLKQVGTEVWMTSPAARWRLLVNSSTNVMDMTDNYFQLRNRPFTYYLNDDSTVNDVFTTNAPGNDANLGFYPAAPKRDLISLLEIVDLEAGDQVYIDTGIYYLADTNRPVVWGTAQSGKAGEEVMIRGSWHPDGSWFVATNNFVPYGNNQGFFFMEANHVDMESVHFRGESIDFRGDGLKIRGVTLTNRPGKQVSMQLRGNSNRFEDIQVDRGSLTLAGQGNRLERLRQRWGQTTIVGTNAVLMNSVVYSTNALSTGVEVSALGAAVSNCTIVVPNGTALSKRGLGTLHLGHSILVAGGVHDANCALVWEGGNLISDWNNFRTTGSAWIGSYKGKWEKLAYWQAISGQDANSVSFDPQFQNPGLGDFHLNSEVGRWSPIHGGFQQDPLGNHSPLIDLGDPWVTSNNEPQPNGYRRNLGAYGNTAQASKSRTNFWLTALTANDGGVLKGTNIVLRWATSNNAPQTVRLDYSWNGGTTWSNIANGLPATDRAYVWDSTGFPDSFNGIWRVVAEDNSWGDTNDVPFALRNYPHEFYVNDADQTDDVYTDASGNDAADGLTPATPKATLQAILNAYDLEGGDKVYIDTGGYNSTNDIRIIWSRSGNTNAPVVIQGNPFGAYTILSRTGNTNYPALVLDVKASHVELRNLLVRGSDRGLLLESNRQATVDGTVVAEVNKGIVVDGAQGTAIRRSALWKNAVGVQLLNTRTTLLENLTFSLPTEAGIQMANTAVDTLQNNIFIPQENAQAYAVGSATTLLSNAQMDYNLYDFSNPGAGFYAGASTNLRLWQLSMNRDFRSALTNHGLAEVDYPGDLHPLSEYGRWASSPTGGDWEVDGPGSTSWAVDHGNPNSDWDQELGDNGERINIGMYGNTAQASQGSTNRNVDIRTLDGEVSRINIGDRWPLVWSSHLVDDGVMVLVQFNGGATNELGQRVWTTLTNVSANREYFVWQVDITHQTAGGLWRVIATNEPGLVDTSTHPFEVSSPKIGFRGRPYRKYGLVRFDWEGGIPGINYIIEYSDDFGKTWQVWEAKYNGPAPINMSQFSIPIPQAWYTFEDRTSYQQRQRWYRIGRAED